MTLKEIRSRMCDEGWLITYKHRDRLNKPNPLACVECESMCSGGLDYLSSMPADEFRELLCGADCDTCRQPCNLRRIALRRKIRPKVVHMPEPAHRHKPVRRPEKARRPKVPRPRTITHRLSFSDYAMIPYYQKHPYPEKIQDQREKPKGKPPMKETYIPLRGGEATELQLLWACREALDNAEKVLEKRLKACKRWPQFRTMQKWIANITNDLMQTIEPNKAQTFLVNLMNQEIRVRSKSSIHNEPGYTLIPSDVLSDIIIQAMTDTCMLCDGGGCDMAKCKFRKSIKQTMMFEIDESGGVCMGKILLERLEAQHEQT